VPRNDALYWLVSTPQFVQVLPGSDQHSADCDPARPAVSEVTRRTQRGLLSSQPEWHCSTVRHMCTFSAPTPPLAPQLYRHDRTELPLVGRELPRTCTELEIRLPPLIQVSRSHPSVKPKVGKQVEPSTTPAVQLSATADKASGMSPVSPTWEGEDDVFASQVKSHACNWSLRSAQGNVPKRCFESPQPD